MTLHGLQGVDYEERIDFARLRADRFRRCLDAMERHGLDALILGKPWNARYAAGFRNTYVAGKRGFSPTAIVIRESREIHLFTHNADGVPPTVPLDHLHLPHWDPANTTASVKKILGPVARGRIGVDAMSPVYAELFKREMPHAAFVDGEVPMREARAIKTHEEIECLKISLAVAEAGMYAVVSSLEPGTTERALVGVFGEAIARLGVTIPAVDGTFCVVPTSGDELMTRRWGKAPFRELVEDRPLAAGDLVALTSGALYLGYASDVGRTWLCGDEGVSAQRRDLHRRWVEVYEAMELACRPGNTGADVWRAAATVNPPSPMPLAHGIGLGFEPPVIGLDQGRDLDQEWVMQPGMVLVLQPYVWREGVGGVLSKETILITEDGCRRLSNFPYGPLSD